MDDLDVIAASKKAKVGYCHVIHRVMIMQRIYNINNDTLAQYSATSIIARSTSIYNNYFSPRTIAVDLYINALILFLNRNIKELLVYKFCPTSANNNFILPD